jgi:hypothetical protein
MHVSFCLYARFHVCTEFELTPARLFFAGLSCTFFSQMQAQIANAFIIKDHFTQATTLNPNDALSWSLMGRWAYSVASIGWFERQAASLLFATPPSATYEEALEHFLHAEQVSPGFSVGNALQLGKTYIALSNTAEARKWLQRYVLGSHERRGLVPACEGVWNQTWCSTCIYIRLHVDSLSEASDFRDVMCVLHSAKELPAHSASDRKDQQEATDLLQGL